MSVIHKKKLKIYVSGYVLLLPALIVILLFVFWPIFWAFIASFKEISFRDYSRGEFWQIPGVFVGLQNYIDQMGKDIFWQALANTAYYAVVYIPVIIIGAMAAAIFLTNEVKGSKAFRTVLFLPYIVSIVAASAAFSALFRTSDGFVNAVIVAFGGEPIGWLTEGQLAMPVISLMSAWRMMGYYMLIFIAGLTSIPKTLYEAADVDGASAWKQFTSITFPLLLRMTMIVFILTVVDVFKVFQEPYILTRGGPGTSTVTLPYLIYMEGFGGNIDIGSASAISYILFAFALVIAIVQNRVSKNKMDY